MTNNNSTITSPPSPLVLDQVLTVAIGRNDADGAPLDDEAWASFQSLVAAELVFAGGTIVAHVVGDGQGSDGVNDGQAEDSAVFVAINVKQLASVRLGIASLLPVYGQSSACFAWDRAHEPVFATANGFRPAPAPRVDSSWLEEGHARRTQRH